MAHEDGIREGSPSARALLDAVVAISSDLDLHSVLTRIVVAACDLTGARYGALGVLGSDGDLADFITHGLDAHERNEIGELPRGRGILRLLIDEPEPIRLVDLAAHPRSFGFPPHHPPMVTFLGVPVRVRGTAFGNLYLTEKPDGAAFTEQDEVLVMALADAAGFVIDNARAYGLSERRRQWLEASAALNEALQPPTSLARALEQVTYTARAVSGAQATAVIRLPDGGAAVIEATDGPAAGRVPDLLDDIARLVTSASETRTLEVRRDGTLAVVLPLRAHLADPGVLLALFGREHRILEHEERELLTSFAEQAGLALDRVQAVQDREEFAVVADRDRIARDLHDLVIQRLFATGIQLQRLRPKVDDPEVAEQITSTVRDLDKTVRDIRSTIFQLRADAPTSLRSEIQALVNEYVPVLGFAPTVSTSGPIDIVVPHEVADHMLAVLREAISNVARHAFASRAEIQVRADVRQVELAVTDDGTGFSPQRKESGLRNARRRAAALGGSLTVASNHPRGTVLAWRIPLD